MLDDHENLREIILEARLQPTGSRLWWRLATAAVAKWTWQLDREEHAIRADLLRATPALRQELARHWQAFAAARVLDQRLPCGRQDVGFP